MISQKEKPSGVAANTGQGLNGQSVSIEKNDTNTAVKNQALNKPLLSGFGGYHTANPEAKKPRPYITTTIEQIMAIAAAPSSVAKDQAQWAVFSTLTDERARCHEHQRENGTFWALWGDEDKVQGLTWAGVVERTKTALPGIMILVYTSRSAKKDLPKSRLIVPLAEGIPGRDYPMIAKILNDRMEKAGLPPDRATEGAGQLCYLPNRGEFYRYHIIEGEPLDPSVHFADEIQAETERLKREAEEREQRHLESLQKIQARIDSGQANPMEAFKAAYPVELALERYGYTRRGNKWLSPRSESGNPGVSVKNGKWHSHHTGDAGIGQPAKGGGTWGDAFDLFVYYEHGGDFNRAVQVAGELCTTDHETGEAVTITKLNQRQHMRQQDNRPAAYFSSYQVTSEPPAMPRIEFCTAADIVAENPQMEPLIEGLLNKGESLVIHAPGGVGKSMIQQFIALAVAKRTGDPWLLFDKFEIRQEMASLFIQSENSKSAINTRYRGMIQADPDRLKNICFPTIHGDVMLTGRSFEDEAFINHIVEMIRQIEESLERKIDLLFVDPLVSYHNGDENDAGRMRAALDGLTQACQRAKVTPIVAHHDNRQGEYRGSSAIYDWTRNMVKMKTVFVGEDRIIDFKGDQPIKRVAKIPCIEFEHEKANNLPRFEKFTLHMDQDFIFRLVDNSLPPETRERCHEVQQALRDLGGTAESHNQLAKAVHELSGRSLSTCKTDVAKSVQHEFIQKHSTGDKSKPYAYTIDN